MPRGPQPPSPQAISAEAALRANPEKSDRGIAAELHLAQSLVRKVRLRLEASGAIPARTTKIHVHAARAASPGAVWRPVPGWEGYYEVSDHGDVRNARTKRVLAKRILHGYVRYSLRRGTEQKHLTAHRLVAGAFLGAPTGPIVRHLDDVKQNNHVSNLAYGDHAQNAADAVRNGTRRVLVIGGTCRHGHLLDEATLAIRLGKKSCRECSRKKDRDLSRRRREAKPTPELE